MKNPFSLLALDSVSALLFQSDLVEKDASQHHHNKNTLSHPAKWNHPSKTLDSDLHDDDSASVASTSSSSSSLSQHADQSSAISCKSVRFDESRNHIYYCSVADKNYSRHSHDDDDMMNHDNENHERWYSRADLMHFKYSTNLLARTIRQQSEAHSRNNNPTRRASLYVAPSSSTTNSTTHSSSINEAATTMTFAHCCRLCSIQNQKEEEPILPLTQQDEDQHEHQNNNQHPLDASLSPPTSCHSILPPYLQSHLQQWFQESTTGPIRWGLATAGSTSMMMERTQRRQALYQIIRQEQRRRQQERRQDDNDKEEDEHRPRAQQQASSSWWEYASTATFLTGYHAHDHEEEKDDYSSTNQADPVDDDDDAKEELSRKCIRISQPSILFAREVALAQAAILQREEKSCEVECW